MATTKKRNKSAKPPTAKQLKARRAFTRMAKARAKEARQRNRLAARGSRNGRSAVKRSPSKRNKGRGASCLKNGKRLYGAAAQAVLKSRNGRSAKNPRNPGVIRMSETQARGYGGKIKGISGQPVSRGKSRKGKVRNGATCIKNGKRLYGAAAQAVLNSRAKRNPKAKREKVGNKGFWRGHVKRAVSKRLHMPIRFGKKRRNAGTVRSTSRRCANCHSKVVRGSRCASCGLRNPNQAPAGVAAMHETFLGQPVKSTKVIAAPDNTPRDVAVIGQIVELKSETETFNFKPGEAPLGANGRGDLFVLGNTKVESNTDFGKLIEISYVAKKDQLNGKLTEYFHVFGEEGGRPPKLHTDREGMFHIVGGSYSIEAEGITD